MKKYFMDLHIHVGRSGNGLPVKITASPELTLQNILVACKERKGIELVGIVDCASPGVLQDLEELNEKGQLTSLPGGGLRYRDKITVFLGVEMEAKEASGARAHYLAYFPTLPLLRHFAGFLAGQVKNPQLSTQACYLPAKELLVKVYSMGGLFIPAHVFTPYKSLFGSCAAGLDEIFGEHTGKISAIELGLSADSQMACALPELRQLVFLSNSDAHSLDKIGREYNQVRLEKPDFQNLKYLLSGQKERKVISNFGMDPKLGKYHRSYCNKCQKPLPANHPVLQCPCCHEKKEFVTGVLDRIMFISGKQEKDLGNIYAVPYRYQVPLSFFPGIGKKTVQKLLRRFGSEMNVLHQAKEEELTACIGARTAGLISRARQGDLQVKPGAGGIYGQIESR